MIYVGIDGGLHGAVCVLNEFGEVEQVFDMPILKLKKDEFDIQGIISIFEKIKILSKGDKIVVALEKAHVRPVQGIRAAFTTGYGLGILEGVLSCMNLSYEIVNPVTWQKIVFEGNYNKEIKKYSTIWAVRKSPEIDWKDGSKNIKDGRTDSYAISYFLYLKNKGKVE